MSVFLPQCSSTGGEFYQQVGGTRNISKKLKCFQTVVALTNLRCLFLLQNMMVFLRSSVRERMNQHSLNIVRDDLSIFRISVSADLLVILVNSSTKMLSLIFEAIGKASKRVSSSIQDIILFQ